jgi:protein TonB
MNAASDSFSTITPAEFPRGQRPPAVKSSSRMIACLLTAAVYGVFALLWHGPFGMVPQPAPIEIVTRLVPNVPVRKLALVPPPFRTHLIHPPVESISPPAFTVATEAPPAPLPASAAASSPLNAGAADSNGLGGSANGLIGNGSALSGCWDAAWAQAVSNRIGQFFYYPERAGRNHVTGWVMVRMVIRHNGRLNRVEVLKSSGNRLLDSAATDMVRKAQPLPAIPERMHADKIEAAMPIAFGPPAPDNPSADSCGR